MSNYTIEVTENVVNLDVLKDHDIVVEITSSDNFITFDTPSGYPILATSGILTADRVGSGYLIENLSNSNTLVRTFGNQSISGVKNFETITVNSTAVSLSGHNHLSSDITNFNNSVSGLLPVTNVVGGTNINVSKVGSVYTVNVSGQLGLTAEEVDDRVSSLLLAGTGITLNYNDNGNTLTINTSGLQPSGNYSIVGHSHNISDVNGLQNALDNKQPSGNYASGVHSHLSSNITDFNSSVSGLLPITALSGISGISITNTGSNYRISLTDPTIQLVDITDLSSNARSFLLTPSSSNLQTLVTDETGSGSIVFNNSPSFSGIPTVPTASSGTNTNQIASTAFVRTELNNLVNAAPNTLDTLNELAIALGNDANFSTTITNSLAGKASLSGAVFTGSISGPSGNFTSLKVNNVDVSVSGHSHTSSDITNFNSSVSGLLPVKNITAGTGISISSVDGIYNINSTVSGVAEAASLVTSVFNKTASTINKGSVVYIDGGQGDQPTIQLAIANGESGSSKTYGIVQSNIPSMSAGKVVVAGALTGFNTDQFNPTAPNGDVNGVTLYLSPTTSGSMTTTKPSSPNHMVSVGTIVRTHQNAGVVEVKIQNGFELYELHDVAISGVSNGQFLQYNTASGLWVASSSGNFSSLTVNNNPVYHSGILPNPVTGTGVANHIPYWSSTSGLLADSNQLIWDASNNRLGIGTSSPSKNLDIIGDARVSGVLNLVNISDSTDKSISVTSNNMTFSAVHGIFEYSIGLRGSRGSACGMESNATNGYLALAAGGSEKVRIATNGNIGVGVTNPLDLVHISGSTAGSVGIRFDNNDGHGGSIQADNGQLYLNSSTATAARLSGRKVRLGDGSANACALELSSVGTISQDGNGGGLSFSGTNAQFSNGINVTGSGIFTGDVLVSGSIVAGSGTAALPTFEFVNDADTGMFNPVSNMIGFSTSGVERLRINDIGNVGIGTLLPQAGFRLDVNGAAVVRGSILTNSTITEFGNSRYQLHSGSASNSVSYVCNGGGRFGVGFTAPSGLVAISGGVAIGSNYNVTPPTNGLIVEGDVGIGTASPLTALHVSKSVNAASQIVIENTNLGTAAQAGIRISNSIGAYSAGFILGGDGFTNNAFLERHRSTLYGAFRINYASAIHRFWAGTGGIGLDTSGAAHLVEMDINRTWFLKGVSIGSSYSSTPPTNGLIVQGNVGIGTASPQELVHISGAIAASNGNLLRLNNGNSTSNPSIDFRIGGVGNYDSHFFISRNGTDVIGIDQTNRGFFLNTFSLLATRQFQSYNNSNAFIELQQTSANDSTANFRLGWISPASLIFLSSYTERMRLTASGNLGIGTSTPSGRLDVAGDVYVRGTGNNLGTIYFKSTAGNDTTHKVRVDTNGNLFLDGGGAFIKVGSQDGAAEMQASSTFCRIGHGYDANSANQNIQFRPANIERMRITNSGLVGIGTSTPSSLLDVNGNVNIDGNLTFDSFTESVTSNGNSGSGIVLSLASGTVHTCTLTNNCTFTMPTATAGKSFTMFLNTGSGNFTASFSGVRWADNSIPTATILANKVDIYSFISDGSFWYGSFSQNYG